MYVIDSYLGSVYKIISGHISHEHVENPLSLLPRLWPLMNMLILDWT